MLPLNPIVAAGISFPTQLMAALSQPRPRTHVDELIQKARQGDDDAFRSVYEQTSAHVYALCLRMMKDETRARDMTQDTYVRAWQHLETYRGESAFTTWLHTIATNACLVALRSRRRRREGNTEIEELEAMPGSNPGDPVDRIALEGPSPICPMGHERCCCCTTSRLPTRRDCSDDVYAAWHKQGPPAPSEKTSSRGTE